MITHLDNLSMVPENQHPEQQLPEVKVLLVDDSEEACLLTKHLLMSIRSPRYRLEWVQTFDEGLKGIKSEEHDVVLLDYKLGQLSGLDLLSRVMETGCEVPIILFTSTGELEIDHRSMSLGAADFLDKGNLHPALLDRSIRFSIQHAKNLKALKLSESRQKEVLERLGRSRDDLLAILDQLKIGVALIDEQDRISFLNRIGRKLLNVSTTQSAGIRWSEILPANKEEIIELERQATKTPDDRSRVQLKVDRQDGSSSWMEVEVIDDPRNPDNRILCLHDTSELRNLRRMLEDKAHFHELVGKSPGMQHAYQNIREFAGVDWTVLIQGDSGTGKELVARAIHAESHRKGKPFIAVNCGGLTDSLLNSQLFGHRKGAFTGAIDDHRGFFEAAHEGTLFLDEIGELPFAVQSSLLRVLQEREILRIGDTQPRKIDVRVIAATHRDLEEDVENGRFRLDLLYRLKVGTIDLPPLRERVEDIPLLIASILRRCRTETGKDVDAVSAQGMQDLMDHYWAGNVRELKSVIEVGALRCVGRIIQASDLTLTAGRPRRTSAAPHLRAPGGATFPLESMTAAPAQDERTRILEAIERAGGNRTRAARLLGIGRATLYRRMEKLELT